MPESLEERWAPEHQIRELQVAIDHSNLRRAGDLSMAEKLKLGADLYDDGIRWLKQILKAEQPGFNDQQIDEELDRRKSIKRRVEEAGLFRICNEDELIG